LAERLRKPSIVRSVSKGPGRRLLIATLCFATWRESPATNAVRPARAPLERPRSGSGIFTARDVTFTMRPKRRAIMPSTTARISMMGVIMLALTASCHVFSSQSRKSPSGGPPALLTRMSGAGHAASTAARPSGVVMSQTTAVTPTPVSLRISSAVASSRPRERALITRSTPSRARAWAQPRPSPWLDAHTMALRPRIP